MGTSWYHTNTAPLVSNTSTGYILPQINVVFDNQFATVGDSDRKEWLSMFGNSRFQYVLEDQDEIFDDNLDPKFALDMERQEHIDASQSTYASPTLLPTYTLPPNQLERGNQQKLNSFQLPTPRILPADIPIPTLLSFDNSTSSYSSDPNPVPASTPTISPTDEPTATTSVTPP